MIFLFANLLSAQSDSTLTDSLNMIKEVKIDSNTFVAKEKLGFNLE